MRDPCKNIGLTVELCEHAVLDAFTHKWHRRSVLNLINKYGGVTCDELTRAEADGHNMAPRLEAAHSLACEVCQRVEDLMDGTAQDLDLMPVRKFKRVDGISGKCRELTDEEPMQQVFDHLATLGLEPLFRAKLLPWQYASIPGRGQTSGARRIHRWLNRKGAKTKHARKTDVRHAYQTTSGDKVMELLRKDVPRAKWQLVLVEALLRTDPGGALLIGSYLSAWLFNYVMSKFLRYIAALQKLRRGTLKKLVSVYISYMDDVATFADREADLVMAIKRAGKWLHAELGLELKRETVAVDFLTIEEERRRRRAESPAARGCPGIDMMGFVVHRTYVTIRRRIFRRIRRQYLRAARDLERAGRIPLYRCYKLVSYYGDLANSDSRRAREHLNADQLAGIAKATIGAAARKAAEKERIAA